MCALAVVACATFPDERADALVARAWLRPVAAGGDTAIYFDITLQDPATLVGASSPVARDIAIVARRDDGAAAPVASYPMAVGMTRFALHGNHLELHGARESLANGDQVLVDLLLVSKSGARKRATFQAEVRGLGGPAR